jgi:RHS repeat-associated protein
MYERDSFVPLVQATRHHGLQLAPTTDVKALMAGNDGKYDIALDPLWNGEFEQEAEPFAKEEIAFYQCDHLGTPQELTDHEGKVAWSAQYEAWGQAKEAISEAAYKAGMRNPIRFQGQYLDEETGLFYNRYRYYDPNMGRYISRDPIGLLGSLNAHAYAPNPTEWVDPLGLSGNSSQRRKQTRAQGGQDPKCCPCPESGYLYRGVSAKHPAFADARRGIAAPALGNGGASAQEHNEGGHSGQSQYTSWSRQKSIAQWHANKDGSGGVLLSAPFGAPKEGDCWSWEFSDDVYGEDEVLLRGRRSGLGVHKP